MLLTVLPLTSVAAAVSPDELSIAMLQVSAVLSNILPTISPREDSLAVHSVLFPLTFVFSTIKPSVTTSSIDAVHVELPNECRAISPLEGAKALLSSALIVTLVDSTVGPRFNTVAILLVILPCSHEFCSVLVLVSSVSVSSVIEPFSFVYVTIRVDHSSQTLGLIIHPVAFVLATVFPDLDALSVSLPRWSNLTLVHGSIIKFEWSIVNEHYTVVLIVGIQWIMMVKIVVERSEPLLCIF